MSMYEKYILFEGEAGQEQTREKTEVEYAIDELYNNEGKYLKR